MLQYTDETFKQFLLAELGESATILGWSLPMDVFDRTTQYVIDDCNVSSVSDEADPIKLRALGRLYLWRAVMSSLSLDFVSAADGSISARGSLMAQAEKMYRLAQADCIAYNVTYSSHQTDVTYIHDPYNWRPYNGRPV